MKVVLDGVSRDVTVERAEDGFTVVVEGRRYAITDVSVTRGTLAFLIDRTSHVAHVSRGGAGVEISIGGRTYAPAPDEVDADRPVATGRGGDGRVEAPMPGSIVAVNVAPGDAVKSGEALVVLESMKMHNEVVSPFAGTVRSVNCRVGEQVAFRQVLVEIGAE